MTKLKCIGGYKNREYAFADGQVAEFDDAVARMLLTDAPGSFVPVVEPEAKAPEAPAADKMMREPARKKARG